MSPRTHYERLRTLAFENDIEGLKRLGLGASPEERGLALDWAIGANLTEAAVALARMPCPQEYYNFGLQQACSHGNATLAAGLLPLSSIISVSRSLKKAAYAGSLECLALLEGRLDAESGWDDYDTAIALRDASDASCNARALVAKLASRAAPGCLEWALRESAGTLKASACEVLMAAGANPDATPPWPSPSGATLTARETFRLASSRYAGREDAAIRSRIESIEIGMDAHLGSSAASPARAKRI